MSSLAEQSVRARVLVGGVGELYQGDLDLGRHVVERLTHEDLGPGVLVEELHYGAVAVAQRLEDLQPDLLILVGAVVSGRPPGTVVRRVVEQAPRAADEVQRAVGDAVTGYVGIDLVLEVAAGLGALPEQTIAIEIEPASVEPSVDLSSEGAAALERVLQLVRKELRAHRGSEAEWRAAGPPSSPRPESRRPTS